MKEHATDKAAFRVSLKMFALLCWIGGYPVASFPFRKESQGTRLGARWAVYTMCVTAQIDSLFLCCTHTAGVHALQFVNGTLKFLCL